MEGLLIGTDVQASSEEQQLAASLKPFNSLKRVWLDKSIFGTADARLIDLLPDSAESLAMSLSPYDRKMKEFLQDLIEGQKEKLPKLKRIELARLDTDPTAALKEIGITLKY